MFNVPYTWNKNHKFWWGLLVDRSRKIMCAAFEHHPASLTLGWVTTRVSSVEYSPLHIQTTLPPPLTHKMVMDMLPMLQKLILKKKLFVGDQRSCETWKMMI